MLAGSSSGRSPWCCCYVLWATSLFEPVPLQVELLKVMPHRLDAI